MAGGQQINSGQGTIAVEGTGATEAITGSAATTEAGSSTQGTSIRLRSRKVGGGAASFLLTGQFATAQQETPVKQVSALLSTPAATSTQGSFGKERFRSLSGVLVQISQTSIGDQTGGWDINAVNFTQGTVGSAQLPVPSGYLTGGVYQVASGTLPSGITLSESGLLSYDGVGAAASVSMTFAYTEPGALPVITLYNNTPTGTFPYMASVFPMEGSVPSGYTLTSPEDSSMRASVISTYPDGSARVMVIAGQQIWPTSNSSRTINLRAAQVSDTALTTATIASRFTSGITVNFSGTPQTLNTWTSPHRIWWANSQVICARYILSCGLGQMEAHIDVHAFATGHTFVEFVIENSKINCGLSTPPMLPAPNRETYTNATLAINGVTVATVNPPVQGTYGGANYYTTGTHEKFRAFYVGAWMNTLNVATPIRGASDPFIELSHDTTHMQAHPIWPGKNARAKTHNPQAVYGRDHPYIRPGTSLNQPYSDDLYQPWDIGRFKAANMANPGWISQLSWQDWRYVQGPDRYTRRAVIASTLGYLSYYINYRDTTGDVPSFTRVGNKFRNTFGYLPFESGVQPDYSYYHQFGTGLMGFLCQPSPCFIELMQKKCIWDGTLQSSVPIQTGGNGGTRSLAFYTRHLVQAVFATPDGHPWKASGEAALYQQLAYVDGWRTGGGCKLNVISYGRPDQQSDQRPTTTDPFYEVSMWQVVWLTAEVHKAVNAKVLSNSTQLAAVRTLRDWMLDAPVRMVNEQAATGGWRYQCSYQIIGSRGAWLGNRDGTDESGFSYWNGTDHGGYVTWDAMAQDYYPDYPPPTVNGPWMVNFDTGRTSAPEDPIPKFGYASYNATTVANHASEYDYCTTLWPWYCMAVEADRPGATQMWSTITGGGITNLTTWLNGFGTDLEDGIWPRNLPVTN